MSIYNSIRENFEAIFGNRDDDQKSELERRLKDAEANNMHKKAVAEGRMIEPDSILHTNVKLYAPDISKKKQEKFEKNLEGLDIIMINDAASKMFAETYWFEAKHFPTNELDSQGVIEDILDMKQTVFDVGGEKMYMKYVMAAIVDTEGRFGKKGEVLAMIDGFFAANKEGNMLYLSHSAVKESLRRKGFGSAVQNAVIEACKVYAAEAEKALGVTYAENSTGSKVQALVGEFEFIDKEDPMTVKRLNFHRKNGWKICNNLGKTGSLRYLQPDTEYAEDGKFKKSKWVSLPLYGAVRYIGNESKKSVEGNMLKNWFKLLYDGFALGMNEQGVEQDRKYALKNIGKSVDLLTPPTPAEAEEFVRLHGDKDRILKEVYPTHKYTKKYLAEQKN